MSAAEVPITLNGAPATVPPGGTVADLVRRLGLPAGAKVEVVGFVGGG